MCTNREELLKNVGQLIFFGFDGFKINNHVKKALHQWHLGNVILFTRNFQSPEQFFNLVQQLQIEAIQANGKPLFIAVDQEGGSVTRMTSGATWFSGAMATRAAGNEDLAFQTGYAIGAEMARFGLNFNLAPLVDLANNPDSAHIGARSFGATPNAIKPYAKEYINGMQQHVIATAKHFPSIGGSNVDLHLQLGCNNSTLQQLESCEMAAVKNAVKNKVMAVMTSHEVYPAVENCPGTLSKKLINEYLRSKFGFKGLIISDCMEMTALAQRIRTPQGCVQAIKAGVDLLLICHTEKTQIDSAIAIADAVKSGEIKQEIFENALTRINNFKNNLKLQTQDVPNTNTDNLFVNNRAFASSVCEKALTSLKGEHLFNCNENERFLFISPPPAATTMADETNGAYNLTTAVKNKFKNAICVEYSLFSSDQKLEKINKILIDNYSKIFIATYNAHTDPSQIKLLNLAYKTQIPVIGLALRSPFDARWYGKAQGAMLCYEYTPPIVNAVIRRLKGEISCKGVLPKDILKLIQTNNNEV